MKRKAKRQCKSCKFSRRQSLILGLFSDLWVTCKVLVAIVAWPVRTAAHAIHAETRKHPALRYKHMHSVLCILLGLCVLSLSFWVEHMFKHPASGIAVETLRAAGVCPVWETLSRAMQFGSDFE